MTSLLKKKIQIAKSAKLLSEVNIKGTDSSWIYYLLEIKLVKEINLLHHV